MTCSARSSMTVNRSSGSEAAAASSGLGGYWNRLQILVVMVWKPAGNAKIAGEPNSVIACRNATRAASEQRRQHQRNGDAPRGIPAAAAEDRGGVFQFAGRAIERIGDQHEDVRGGVAGHQEDDAT